MAIHIPMIQGRIITITTGGSTPSEPTAPNGKVLYKTSANGDWIQSDADITDGTFNDFDEIKSAVAVILPSKDASGNTVTNIGYRAFYRCDSLTSVAIPDSVTIIEYEAFTGCIGLTNVTIGDNVTSIEYGVFYGCHSLTNITIPDSVTSIGYRAFVGCRSLTSITIPNNVTSIGENTFYGCNGLTRVTFNNFDVSTTKTQITENHIFGTKFHDEN